MSGLKLLVSENNGVNVPLRFLQDYNCEAWGIPADSSDVDSVWEGPHSDWYWESWDAILDSAKMIDSNGKVWRLHMDGDLWAWCDELMDADEYRDFFGEERI